MAVIKVAYNNNTVEIATVRILKSLLFVFILFPGTLFAQTTFKKNAGYVEILGNGIVASLNYERQLMKTPGLGIRVGLGYFSGNEVFRLSVPAGINYLFNLNNNRSFIDAGVGITRSGAAGLKTAKQDAAAGGRDYSEYIWSFIPSLGYRHNARGNFMWRISFTPILNKYITIPWAGISIGKVF